MRQRVRVRRRRGGAAAAAAASEQSHAFLLHGRQRELVRRLKNLHLSANFKVKACVSGSVGKCNQNSGS